MNEKTKKMLGALLIVVVLLSAMVYLHLRGKTGQQDLKGRDFVRLGEFQTLSGDIYAERGEWILQANGAAYELHLGDHTHRERTGMRLEEGKTVNVSGYVYSQRGADFIDLAVCTVQMDGREYRFREDDGTPMWRGQWGGDRPGQAQPGQGRGDGTGSADGTGQGRSDGSGQGRNR